jgi:flagellum-specific peptidoglycan hydrolase FlgJ
MTMQETFLQKAYQAAEDAGHIFPEYAACEAALESGWGLSHLATEANNLFGQKQAHPPLAGTETISLPTREYLHGAWTTIQANWIKFPDWAACFAGRMRLLKSLAAAWPHYSAALSARTGEAFIHEVSKSWSTDPQRAGKVLAIYDRHRTSFKEKTL